MLIDVHVRRPHLCGIAKSLTVTPNGLQSKVELLEGWEEGERYVHIMIQCNLVHNNNIVMCILII